MNRKLLIIERIRKDFLEEIGRDIKSKKSLEFMIMATEDALKNIDKSLIGKRTNLQSTADLFKSLLNFPSETCFKIADRFAHHLHKTKLDVVGKFLPREQRCILVELPESMNLSVVYEGGNIRIDGATVSTHIEDGHRYLVVRIWFIDSKNALRDRLIMVGIDDDMSVERCLREFPLVDKTEIGINDTLYDQDIEVVLFFAKILVYLHSSEPDIKSVHSIEPLTKKHSKIRRHWQDNYMFDVVTVGYGFHGKTYSVDETSVCGHFRWQRHGPDMSLVKLIWIDEHIRHFERSVANVEAAV